MSKSKNHLDDYIRRVESSLKSNNYSDEKTSEIVEKIRGIQNYKKANFKFLSWRNIISNNPEHFENVQSNDIKYFILDGRICAIVVRETNELYNVAFSFIHDDDLCYITKVITPLTKKHTLWNYVNSKYRYDSIKATSSINALTLAYNENCEKFPIRSKVKITPYLRMVEVGHDYCVPGTVKEHEDVYDNEIGNKFDSEYRDLHKNYVELKKQLLSKVGNFSNVRFYLEFCDFNVMVVRKPDSNEHTVTFSFIHPSDKKYIVSRPCGDIVKMCKKCTIENYLENKYTYTVTDARNSISAVVRAYNLYKKEFPAKWYSDFKLKVDIQYKYTDVCMNCVIAEMKYFIPDEIKCRG